MKHAYDPSLCRQISAQDYLARHGMKVLGSNTDDRQKVFCEICEQQIKHRAGKTADSYGHFYHPDTTGYCPTKAPSATPYENLTPRQPDPVRGKWLRTLVSQNWRWAFVEMSKRVACLDIKEFVMLITAADAAKLWQYAKLELLQVPELLLVIRDFTPDTSKFKERKYWLRFWFSANIRVLDDLWVHAPNAVRLLRASFPPPRLRQTRPRYEEMIHLTQIERVTEFYEVPADRLRSFELNHVVSTLGWR